MSMLHRLALVAGLALGVASAPADASSLRFSGIHFFGDSLSDPGNAATLLAADGIPFPPIFPLGKASDGPLWSEIIATKFLGEGGRVSNHAYATGRIAPDDAIPAIFPGVNLPAQLRRFAATTPAPLPGNDLGLFWIGNNDMLRLIRDATPTPTGGLSDADRLALEAQATTLANTVVNSVAVLSPFGLNDFVFLKLPDFGLIPRFNVPVGDPTRNAVASLGAQLFNEALETAVADLAATGVRASIFDFDRALRRILADPAALGVTPLGATFPCVAVIGTTPSVADLATCREHFFYDDIHPTSTLHAALAAEFRNFVAIPLPAAGWLLLAALAGLGGLARAKRRA